jgi:hypothetical protein
MAYPLTPPTMPGELPRTLRRWSPSPGAPLKGRRLATLAVTEGGRRRYVVDLATGAKFWAIEMPPARQRQPLDDLDATMPRYRTSPQSRPCAVSDSSRRPRGHPEPGPARPAEGLYLRLPALARSVCPSGLQNTRL